MQYVENGMKEDCAKLCFKGMSVPLCELSHEEYRKLVYEIEVVRPSDAMETLTDKPRVSEKGSLLDVPVKELELTTRAGNCLRRADIRTIGRLLEFCEADLMKLRNMGDRSLDEIKEKLAERGLKLKEVPEEN